MIFPMEEKPPTTDHLRVLVCQLGAREHYLVARCCARSGVLACLVTDFWSPVWPAGKRLMRWLPKVVLSALARCHPDLDGHRVCSTPVLSMLRYGIGRIAPGGRYDEWIARRFARHVRGLKIDHNVFFGYSYDSLEILRDERRNGVLTILCQTDPGPAHYQMVSHEEDQWPDFVQARSQRWTQEREARVREEWDLADVIVVNSAWTKKALIAEGVDAEKIEILPLAYEENAEMLKTETLKTETLKTETLKSGGQKPDTSDISSLTSDLRPPSSVLSPLRVLWLGNVALGKGIHYLIEAARLLVDEPVEFLVGGTHHISSAASAKGPSNIRWHGQIPRNQTNELYDDCDVFVFPTLSDGFGITQLEAMTRGLPVIATPNCGQVVEDGVTGFIVPPRDPQALADAILKFVRNPELAAQMSVACKEAVKAFSVDAYSRRLFAIIRREAARTR
jgi:glycosyltransferase involved in cell wall biosynthesis